MSFAWIAVNRGLSASREATPGNSRTVSASHSPNSNNLSCFSSREVLDVGNLQEDTLPNRQLLDNHSNLTMRATLDSNCNPNNLAPSSVKKSTNRTLWDGHSSNSTSTNSTPFPENNSNSGGGSESSPLSSPLSALDYLQSNGNSNASLYCMPIVGYEVLEERSRFTVFKIQVMHRPSGDQWFVFRRYTDFVRLNKKLRSEFPGLRFALPPKKWFGDNFDPIFLEDRQLGLQAFIDNIIGHTKIRERKFVRDFFCLDDPPGPHDTLEESRAMCQCLEENIADLQEQLRGRDGEIAVLKSQVNFLMAQQHTLVKALRLECEIQGSDMQRSGSTHELNMTLLNICEKTMTGRFSNSNCTPSLQNREVMVSEPCALPPLEAISSSQNASTVNSAFPRALEKVFIPSEDPHSSHSGGNQTLSFPDDEELS